MLSALRVNHLAYFFAVLVNGVANFALIAVLVRTFSANSYSLLVLAATALSFSMLLDMGIGLAVTRGVAESLADNDILKSSHHVAVASLLFNVVGLTSAVVLLAFPYVFGPLFPVADMHRETFRQIMCITAIHSLIVFHYAIWSSVAMGFQRHAIVHFTGAFGNLVKLGAVVMVCTSFPIPELISACYAVVAMLSGLTVRHAVRLTCFSPPADSKRPSLHDLRHIANVSVSTSVGSIAGKVVTESDRFAIGSSNSPSLLAQYDVMLSLANFTRHILYSTAQLIAAFARLKNAAETQIALLTSASGICFASYTVLFAFILGWGEMIVELWVGRNFLPMLPALFCLLAGTLIQSVSAPSHFLLVAVSDLTFYRRIHLVQIGIKIVFAAALLFLYGAIGVALSTVGAYLVTEVAVLRMAARTTGMKSMRLVSNILLLGLKISALPLAVMVALTLLMPHTVLSLCATAAATTILLAVCIYRVGLGGTLSQKLQAVR
jgi:O-antigen/teichoic acid export membrane protein